MYITLQITYVSMSATTIIHPETCRAKKKRNTVVQFQHQKALELAINACIYLLEMNARNL